MSASAQGAVLGVDRFVLKERIGGGAMGEVFRAYDRERNEDVALKMLRDPEPQKVYLFKREFRALAGVAHPNLVRLHELVSAGDRWFFTMELLHGVDFLTWVRRDTEAATAAAETPTTDVDAGARAMAATDWSRGSLDLETSTAHSGLLRRAAPTAPAPVLRSASPLVSSDQWTRLREGTRQLASGVQALHDHGSLHRDIKPSNVMVTADGRVVLLDFGIIATLSRPAATDGPNQLYGTPAYMAPEVGTRRGFDAPADWYAVGVMLYEAMAGRRPFAVPSMRRCPSCWSSSECAIRCRCASSRSSRPTISSRCACSSSPAIPSAGRPGPTCSAGWARGGARRRWCAPIRATTRGWSVATITWLPCAPRTAGRSPASRGWC
jgi:eukaryotic-like serine/threonine-protein kinase